MFDDWKTPLDKIHQAIANVGHDADLKKRITRYTMHCHRVAISTEGRKIKPVQDIGRIWRYCKHYCRLRGRCAWRLDIWSAWIYFFRFNRKPYHSIGRSYCFALDIESD